MSNPNSYHVNHIELPKSAAIRFDGPQLKIHDAFLLLVRTASGFNRNDPIFKLFKSLLRKTDFKNLKDVYSFLKKKGFIISNLYYLDNYYYENIGGVLKGICKLDGTFNSFNLCKYPSYESVLEELTIIANEFPNLEVTANIYDSCITDDSKKPIFSFLIKDGTVINSDNHLSSLIYIHEDYEYLNYNHLNLFAKLLSKDIFSKNSDMLNWVMKRKYFEALLV